MMDTTSTPNQIVRNNRKALLLTVAAFLVPVIIAYALLKTGWYRAAGTVNKGMLITPPIVFDNLSLYDTHHMRLPVEQFRKKWWILFVVPQECDAACKNSLYQMRQVHKALGADQSRVAELIVTPYAMSADFTQWLEQEFPEAERAATTPDNLNATLNPAFGDGHDASQAGHLFLVDTMGAIFMHYPGYADEHESVLKGRDLLRDLQRVLKYSKIG